jgi:hypothetical protein
VARDHHKVEPEIRAGEINISILWVFVNLGCYDIVKLSLEIVDRTSLDAEMEIVEDADE